MTSRATISISVFFPCYNEEENLRPTVNRALSVLEDLSADYEIIIVNDGSRDSTGAIADEGVRNNSRIRVVHHPTNRGYGAALRSGFEAAGKDLVFYTDGDGQFDIREMPALLPLMERNDIVSCYRRHRADPLIRRFNAWCWTILIDAVFGMRIRDIDCAFKLYKRNLFDEIHLSSTGALIDAEILARATRKGFRVTQKGVHHYPRTKGIQTGASIRVILQAFSELFRLRTGILNKR